MGGGGALRGVLYDAWTHLHTSCFISTICQVNKHLLGPVLLKWRDYFSSLGSLYRAVHGEVIIGPVVSHLAFMGGTFRY